MMAKSKRKSSKKILGHDPLDGLDITGIDQEEKYPVIETLGHDPFEGMEAGGIDIEQEDELFPLLAQGKVEELIPEDALLSLVAQAGAATAPDEIQIGPAKGPPDTPALKRAIAAEIKPLIQVPPLEPLQEKYPAAAALGKRVLKPIATFHFPADFKWGVATAAHQVEGGNDNNDWWAWEQQEGRIKEGDKSGQACDWWENAEPDFASAAAMGMNALRLSVEWSRVEPRPGEFDDSALERYAQMLQGLRMRNIEPMVTLHHFTNPCWLADQGGWENPQTIPLFARFARRVVERLGQYCDLWCTINEPNVYGYLGYLAGIFPPGQSDPGAAMLVIRHLLAGHAAAYREIHAAQPHARVGLAHNMRILDPANPKSLLDRCVAQVADRTYNQAILTALTRGRWTLPLGFGLAWKLRRTLDWVGLNYYTRDLVAFDRTQRQELFSRRLRAADAEPLDGGYGEFYPHGMFRCLQRLARLRLPIYVTENGIPDDDDDQRPRYLMTHLHQMWHAIQLCYPVMGYYHWTLVDNFEWAEGWALRFGLIGLDTETQARTPRPSADLYAALIRANAITPEIIETHVPELRAELLPG
ncbi:MAG: glycoside hydrolase family 1 protein [Chloroflexi bacterium]|nr:glycoside hydrolase family 1 protein [Chloroflexota bacterium]